MSPAMRRHQLHSLKAWLRSPRRKPLVIRGARQVGKSTLVEMLVRERDVEAELFTVNLERHPQLARMFSGHSPRELLNLNRELTYWLREGRANNAEVDYVAEFAGRIVPIEVKAGRTGTLRSLHQFAAEKRPPLYLVEHLPRIVEDVFR